MDKQRVSIDMCTLEQRPNAPPTMLSPSRESTHVYAANPEMQKETCHVKAIGWNRRSLGHHAHELKALMVRMTLICALIRPR